MTTDHPQSRPPPDASPAREVARLVAGLAATGFLLAACIVIPIVVAVAVNPWIGMLAGIGSFLAWSRFGPRPMPGFLSGALCLWGFAAIAGSFVSCGVVAVRVWLR